MKGSLFCRRCGRSYALDSPRWKCSCGGLLEVDFTPVFDRAKIQKRKPTMWRYREAIPLGDDAHIVTLDEGFTPLLEMELDGRPVWVKQDHLFSTGSYKDRGASVLISKVREMGIDRVVEDSSGNAGCAIAAYGAQAGIRCSIYVPHDTSPAKLAQISLYGAALKRIPGTRHDTAMAVLSAAEETYYASHSWNPFFFEGTKTFAFEVCEQLEWQAPDCVVLPVGNGTLLLGAHRGFRELNDAGIVNRMPRLIGVQAARCAPLAQAFREGRDQLPLIRPGTTIAEGIAIAQPIRGEQIVRAVRETGGGFLTVEEAEIWEALREVCRRGFYVEPTSAAAIAGLRKYLRSVDHGQVVVSAFTGHGLKATEKMLTLSAAGSGPQTPQDTPEC